MEYVDYDAWDGHDPDLSWLAIERFLKRSQQQHKDRLEDELGRIADQLARRDAIHDELVNDLEWQIERYTARLKQLYRSQIGREDGERGQLKDRLAAFHQELQQEHRAHWQDRQTLERDRRDVLSELAALDADEVSELL